MNSNRLDLHLGYSLTTLKLSEITPCEPVNPSDQYRAMFAAVGQAIPLTVIQNGTDKYTLLSEDPLYATMIAMDNVESAECLVVTAPNDTIRELIIAYHCMELGCGNSDEHKFHIVDMLLELVDHGEIEESAVLSIVADLFGQTTRYTRMYLSIVSNGIPELREAVVIPASGQREKSEHIPVQLAARIASLSPEQQRAELAKRRSTDK